MDSRSVSNHGSSSRSVAEQGRFEHDAAPLSQSDSLSLSWIEFAKKEGWSSRTATVLDENHQLVGILEGQFPKLRGALVPKFVATGRLGRSVLFAEALGSYGEHVLPVYAPQIDTTEGRGAKNPPTRMIEIFSNPVGIIIEEFPIDHGQFTIRAAFTPESYANARRHLHGVDTAFRDRQMQYATRNGLISNICVPSYLFQEALENIKRQLELGELLPGLDDARIAGLTEFSVLDKSASKAHLGIELDVHDRSALGYKQLVPYLATIEIKFLYNPYWGVPSSELAICSLVRK